MSIGKEEELNPRLSVEHSRQGAAEEPGFCSSLPPLPKPWGWVTGRCSQQGALCAAGEGELCHRTTEFETLGACRLPGLRNNPTPFYRQETEAHRSEQLAQSHKLSYNHCHRKWLKTKVFSKVIHVETSAFNWVLYFKGVILVSCILNSSCCCGQNFSEILFIKESLKFALAGVCIH